MPLFSLSTSPAKKSQTSMRQEPQETSPMNTDEALKSHCFWQNPNYLQINNNTASAMNTGNMLNSGGKLAGNLSSRYQSNFSLGSQRFSGQFLMIPNPGFVDINSNNLSVEASTYGGGFSAAPMRQDIGSQNGCILHNLGSQKEMRIISKEPKEKEERHLTIKKELTKSDVDYGTCRRLTLAKSSVEEYILKHLPTADAQKMERGKPGITVKVYDHDTDTEHELCMALQRSYVLKNGWHKDFVQRRGLKEGEEIGLLWDLSDSKLHFSVLSRAIAKAPVQL